MNCIGMEVPMPWKETCVMEERLKLILEWQAEEISVSELCRCYGVSRKTAYKWRSRYLSRGASGLSDLSRAPLHHPQALSGAVVASVLEVRHKHPSWGPKKIRAYLGRHRPRVRWPARAASGSCCSGRVWWCRDVSVSGPRPGARPLPHVQVRMTCGASI